MKKVLILSLITFFSCNNNHLICNRLIEGSFDLYENDVFVGKLFRKNNIQIEKYSNDAIYTIVKFDRVNTCQFHLNHYSVLKSKDTITWLVECTPLKEDTFEINARAAYIDTLDYAYKGKMVKISDGLTSEIRLLIEDLVKEYKSSRD